MLHRCEVSWRSRARRRMFYVQQRLQRRRCGEEGKHVVSIEQAVGEADEFG